ncbi:hypothetical protein RB195_021538 [Necator americanus]|uniref:Uncharacterized protein n=1 Tax=Necator americanus TaxID=51031 RepID=A0ABR1EBI6_NECAM
MYSLLLLPFLFWITSAFNNIPIEIDKCKKSQWFVRNFIVFVCLNANARKELKPFACDPNNGMVERTRKRPVFLQETHKLNGFVYECTVDKNTKAVVWRAIACYINEEKFGPGTFVKGRYDSVYLCYKDIDGILRIRMRKPVHDHCIAGTGDPNCQQGILQGIWNSNFGMGQGIAYNSVSNTPLNISNHNLRLDTTNAPIYEYPKIGQYDLFNSIKGFVNPEDVTLTPEYIIQPGDIIP